jgi:hypothetical protein
MRNRDRLILVVILFVITAVGGLFFYYYQTEKLRERINNYLAATFPYSTVNYRVETINPFSRKIVLTDMKIESPQGTATIQKVVFRNVAFRKEYRYPLKVDFQMLGIRFSGMFETFKNIPLPIREMGLLPQEINVESSYVFYPEEKILNISKVVLHLVDLGRIEFGMNLASVPEDFFRSPEKLFEDIVSFAVSGGRIEQHPDYKKLVNIELRKFSIFFKNEGLIQKLIRFVSTMEGRPSVSILAEAEKEIEDVANEITLPDAKKAVLAVKDFLKHPETLSFVVKAKKTLKFSGLSGVIGPEQLKEILTVTLTVNGKEYRII